MKAVFLGCCLLAFFCPRPACAKQATIADMWVINSDEELLLFFSLKQGFTPEVDAGVLNGIPATFNFEVRLEPADKKWAGQAVQSRILEHTLTYDTLKEEFLVQRSEAGDRIQVVKDIASAKRLMTEISGVCLADLASLTPDNQYVVRVKASLVRKTLPLNIQYLIPFWKTWSVETNWSATTFHFAPTKP